MYLVDEELWAREFRARNNASSRNYQVLSRPGVDKQVEQTI